MIAWHYVTTFTPQQAALAIIGETPSNDPKAFVKAAPVLQALKTAYEDFCRSTESENGLEASGHAGTLKSIEAQEALDEILNSGFADLLVECNCFPWLREPAARFENQHFSRDELARWLRETGRPSAFDFGGGPTAAPKTVAACPAEARQTRRYKMCIDAGLTLPNNDYAQMPRGIGKIAESIGISRQAFAEDVRKHINRLAGKKQ